MLLASFQSCMSTNKLKLNPYKTALSGMNEIEQISLFPVELLVSKVTQRNLLEILGVICDKIFTFCSCISAVCSSQFYHVQDLWCIRRDIDVDSAQLLVTALLSSHLDYCNCLVLQTLTSPNVNAFIIDWPVLWWSHHPFLAALQCCVSFIGCQ